MFHLRRLIHVVGVDFLARQLLLVHRPPHVGDVGHDERHEQRHVEHRLQGEHAARTVEDGQAALQLGRRRIVGGVVPSHVEEQRQHHDDHANAGRPDSPHVAFAQIRADDAIEKQHDAHDEEDREIPHLDEIVEIFEWVHVDVARRRVVGEAVLEERADEERKEQHQERHHIVEQMAAATLAKGVVVHIVDDVENAQYARQEEDGKAEDEVPGVE